MSSKIIRDSLAAGQTFLSAENISETKVADKNVRPRPTYLAHGQRRDPKGRSPEPAFGWQTERKATLSRGSNCQRS